MTVSLPDHGKSCVFRIETQPSIEWILKDFNVQRGYIKVVFPVLGAYGHK